MRRFSDTRHPRFGDSPVPCACCSALKVFFMGDLHPGPIPAGTDDGDQKHLLCRLQKGLGDALSETPRLLNLDRGKLSHQMTFLTVLQASLTVG
jgi:hypothetical protein